MAGNFLVRSCERFDLGGIGVDNFLVISSFGFLKTAVVSLSVDAGALALLLSKSTLSLCSFVSFSICLRFRKISPKAFFMASS